MSFTDVIAGHNILATDLNQLVDALNGTVSGAVSLLAASNTTVVETATLPSAPASGSTDLFKGIVTGDTKDRISLGIRSDGYGTILFGPGGSTTPTNLYGAASSALKTDNGLFCVGLSTSGGLSVTSGTTSLDNGAITTDGSGDITIAGNIIFGAAVSGVRANIHYDGTARCDVISVPLAGVNPQGVLMQVWSGSTFVNLFSFGGQFGSAKAFIDISGNLNLPYGGGGTGSGPGINTDIFFQVNSGASRFGLIIGDGTGWFFPIYYYSGGTKQTIYTFTDGGVFTATAAVVCDVFQARAHTYIGFKNNSGGKIAEMRGDFVISGTTFWTTSGSSGFNNSASFDAFDVAEIFATDGDYEGGAVVCPGEDGRMHRCAHDGCHAALVVSKRPGLSLGGGTMDGAEPPEGPYELLAIAGRVRVRCAGDVPCRALVTSDGTGGVRALGAGEAGFALGFALHAGDGGQVGILLRPVYRAAGHAA